MKIAGLIAAALLLAGCGPHNTDPRKGHVTLEESNCWNKCYEMWEVCIGPDLLIHDSRADKDHREKILKNDAECAP